jgi:hypothetical protein
VHSRITEQNTAALQLHVAGYVQSRLTERATATRPPLCEGSTFSCGSLISSAPLHQVERKRPPAKRACQSLFDLEHSPWTSLRLSTSASSPFTSGTGPSTRSLRHLSTAVPSVLLAVLLPPKPHMPLRGGDVGSEDADNGESQSPRSPLFWAYVGVAAAIVIACAVTSALNIGVLDLDMTHLQVLKTSGGEAVARPG